MQRGRILRWCFCAAVLSAHACSSEVTVLSGPAASSVQSGSGGSTTSIAAVSTVGSGGFPGEGGRGDCADLVVEAVPEYTPADIVFIIDNSVSMAEEITAVEQNINVNFASILQSAGADVRVLMLTNHGSGFTGTGYEVCVDPPLSGTVDCSGPPVNVPQQFYHYSVDIQDHDSICKLFDTFFGPNGGGEADHFGLEPNGLNAWLRPPALKVLVEITDAGMACVHENVTYFDGNSIQQGQTAALSVDGKLLELAPFQFGNVADRNYMLYSVVGMPPKTNPLEPYGEFEPVLSGTCAGGEGPGTAYQWLSKGTGALRFAACQDQVQTYDVVFQTIATAVIDATYVPCAFDVPEPPPGEMLDLETIDVIYTPGGGGQPQRWIQVDSASQCGPGKFYIDPTFSPPRIHLCLDACAVIEGDPDGKLEIKIGCPIKD